MRLKMAAGMMSSIRAFDHFEREDAREQAKAMRGSDQPLNECIQFGRTWARDSYFIARANYEVARDFREVEWSAELEVESA